jgi:hypothetical protein
MCHFCIASWQKRETKLISHAFFIVARATTSLDGNGSDQGRGNGS